MSMKHTEGDLKHIDRACDFLANAAYHLDQTEDWIAKCVLHTLEGMIDDLGERHKELRAILDAMYKLKEERDGAR